MTNPTRQTWLVIAVLVAAQLRFVWLDDRLPRDLSFTWRLLESFLVVLQEGRWDQLPRLLSETAGWLNLATAGLFQLTGPDPKVFRALDACWLAMIAVGSASAARTVGGPRAGLATVLLLGGLPLVVVLARLTWVHVPETALLVTALAALLRDPSLAHRRTWVLGVGAAGLALALRPSAGVWVLALAPLVRGAPWRRLLVAGTVLGICALPALGELGPYLSGKLAIRSAYAARVAPLHQQLLALVGPWAGLPALAGAALWIRTRPDWRTAMALGAWTVGPFAAWAVFRTGLENFVVLAPALAIAGGLGLATGRRGLVAAALGFALLTGVQVVPSGLAEPVWGRLPGVTPGWYRESLGDQFRPWTGYGARELPRLLDAVCPTQEPGRCLVAVEQGLLHPDAEDPGRLGLLLLDEARVDLRPVDETSPPLPGAAAVVRFDCLDRPPDFQVSLPGLAPVWSRDVGQGCTVHWLVPGGEPLRPEALPP